MKRLLLTALLLAAPAASAQTTPGATPATTSPAAVTLSLAAPVGTVAELATTTQTRLTLEDVQITGPNGEAAGAEEAAETRRLMQESLNAVGAQVTPGKAFFKVQERAADGNVTLLTTVVTSVPGQGPVNVRVVQRVAPSGQVELARLESDNPLVQSVLANLSPGALRAQADASGGSVTGIYGQALTVGRPTTQTVTLDAQALLGGVFGALASGLGGGPNPFGQVQASPLTVTTTTTSRGLNPAGQHVFETRNSIGNWTVELGGAAEGGASALPRMRLELVDATGSGLSLYRPDGLPTGSNQTQTMRMRVGLTLPSGEQMTMLVRLEQTQTMRPR